MAGTISVEVVYALPRLQRVLRLDLPAGTTAGKAIEASGLLRDHPEIDLATNPIGIYGELARLDSPLRDRDRVEVYRALVADPGELRRRRAIEQGKRKAGAGRRKAKNAEPR